jgi:putative membrane protein insertion efficiency factor
MKKIFIKTIEIYQVIFSVFIKNMLGIKSSCRFSTTCSNYAKASIHDKGVIKGGYLSVVRILKCQPFYKGALL